jgi:hypothetical protein
MSLAFWNNPLVVSAFRVKYRRGTPFRTAALYLMALAMGGEMLHYYRRYLGGSFPRNYYLALMGLQFVVSLFIALSTTSASVRAEVSQRTLDFQRLASLSPRQILLGKLLGQPAMAYLLSIAAFPLVFLCYLWGGVDFWVMLLLYVNLASTTLMFGAMGLLQRLEPPAGKSGSTSIGPQWIVAFFIVVFLNLVPMLIAGGSTVLGVPLAAALLGLPTPVPAFGGIVAGDPWRFGLSFFDLQIPFILITPLAQLGIAFLCFQSMVRQLVNPLNPPFSKQLAYVTLTIVDVIVAGVLFDSGPWSIALGPRCAAFCLIHLLASGWMMAATTPWRETLHSWVWRYRGRRPLLADCWLGDRTENGLALLTFCAIGVASYVVLVVVPAPWQAGVGQWPQARLVAVPALGAMVVLTLAFGTILQWLVFLAGRGGSPLLVTVLALPIAAPHVAGYYYQLPWLEAFSPSAHFGRWLFDPDRPLNVLPLLLTYAGVLVLVRLSLRRRMHHLEKAVDRKLEQMGVGAVTAVPARP